ncbi:hypothetical protein ABIB62_000002 [Mucilaginibacter sp. UYP25]|uniref:hypothetical protein n=1 Tax=unclassified Mucilaginibacter TaxID=2617802 RepID=UPI003393FD07
MQASDLYKEAKQHYHQLVPDREDGLILLALYQQYEDREFTEEQIIDIITQVFVDLGRENKRMAYERNNQIIIRLQEFFLWRDRNRKIYRFKKYGEEFCKRINKRLAESYSPAKIKRIFNYLLDSLQKSKTAEGQNFNTWVDDHFNARSNELAEQIEILDQQVGESVKEFKVKFKAQHVNIVRLIDTVMKGLEIIKAHAAELTNAFQTTYDIDEHIQSILESADAFPYLDNIRKVQHYNDHVRAHLEQISMRIDKIKPQIREFIFEFNQRELDRKTDRFIHYLLNHSSYQRSGGQKKLELPEAVPPFLVRRSDTAARFYIVSSRDLLPKPPVKPPVREIDQVRKAEMITHNEQLLYVKKRISFWSELAMALIRDEGTLDFSPLFFRILAEEQGNLLIPVRTAQRVVKLCRDRSLFHISVRPEPDVNAQFKHLSLWKMNIRRIN